MSRQARRETPRWQRNRAPAGPVIRMSNRQAKGLARQAAASFALQQSGGVAPAPKQGVLVKAGAYRYRHQLVPFWLLFNVAIAGSVFRAEHAWKASLLAAVVAGGAILLLTRHLRKRELYLARATAVFASLWLPLLALFGLPTPAGALMLISWVCIVIPWVKHYRIRVDTPAAEVPPADVETWERLAAKKKWAGTLGPPEKIPGGRRYPIRLDGVETHIGDVMGHPLSIAAAWHKPITEAYVEPSPDGIASRGSLTLLTRGTLQAVREWNGTGVTDDGFAVIGRYADGQDARIRLFAPMDGTRHGLIAGTTGAGKSALLDLLLRLMLTSGFIYPVILDPQEGQSLPDWNGKVPYAAGAEQCMDMLRLVHAAMFARSRRLASMTWDDGGHTRKMSFFDHELTGWPVVAVIADEMHMLLTGEGRIDSRRAEEAISLVKDIGKLGRKTGTGMWLVTQVPSLEELGSQTLRSMLAGGNIICLRTADKVSGGMLGLPADPHDIPQYFPDGDYTYGLGYVLGPDRRQAIARTDIPSAAARRQVFGLPALEPEFAEALSRFGTGSLIAEPAPLAAVPAPADDRPGRTAADAIAAILTAEMSREDIVQRTREFSVSEWRRPEPFKLRSITTALKGLVDSGQVAHTARGSYAPLRASLHVVDGTSSNHTEAAAR